MMRLPNANRHKNSRNAFAMASIKYFANIKTKQILKFIHGIDEMFIICASESVFSASVRRMWRIIVHSLHMNM